MDKLDFLRPVAIKGKIRLGNNRDGGYVLYGRKLEELDALVTYGVGWEISFEEDFNRKTGKTVLMFDPTMIGKYIVEPAAMRRFLLGLRFGALVRNLRKGYKLWRKKMQLEASSIYFINEGIGVAHTAKFDTFAHHLERFKLQDKKIMLKIDIEGGEYRIFEDSGFYACLHHVQQLLMEFHDLKNRLHDLRRIIERLSPYLVLAHIHANNYADTFRMYNLSGNREDELVVPDVLEVLFINRELICDGDLADEQVGFPVPGLDYPNDLLRKDHPVNFI